MRQPDRSPLLIDPLPATGPGPKGPDPAVEAPEPQKLLDSVAYMYRPVAFARLPK
jgi:hypothetical protein